MARRRNADGARRKCIAAENAFVMGIVSLFPSHFITENSVLNHDRFPVSMTSFRPTATLETLHARAEILARIRAFFREREVLEVETPLLSQAAAPDVHIASIPATACGETRYLHTSPEYAMKRLLAAGSGPIWQLCKVFRDGEAGGRHNPEFTMLEWYRPAWTLEALMDEVEALIRRCMPDPGRTETITYRQAFQDALGIDPLTCSVTTLRGIAHRQDLGHPNLGDDPNPWRDLLLTHCVEPTLPVFCFLRDYPADQAALARIQPGSQPPVAERFEVYVNAMELANGYQELTDVAELRRRWAWDQTRRRELGLPAMPQDENLLAAMEHGLPACAGVALGLDRLVMQALGLERIEQVLSFSWERV